VPIKSIFQQAGCSVEEANRFNSSCWRRYAIASGPGCKAGADRPRCVIASIAGPVASSGIGCFRRWPPAMDYDQRGHGWQLREGTSVCPRRKRGAKAQAIGISRSGQTAEVRALTDTFGRPVALRVTAGNVCDITMSETLLAEVDDCRYLLADNGYDSDTCGPRSRRRARSPSFRAESHARGPSRRQAQIQVPNRGCRQTHPNQQVSSAEANRGC
jgi:hypothetical protein